MSDGEIWTAHGGVNPCGLFVRRGDRELRTRWSHTSMRNTENTTSLYWFRPPESNTLRPVVGVDCLRICRGEGTRGIASSALYWPADEVGSQTPGRLRPGDLSLHYTCCHIPSICFRRSPPRSCLVMYAKF
jgi:hypothetical protein